MFENLASVQGNVYAVLSGSSISFSNGTESNFYFNLINFAVKHVTLLG